MKKTPRLWVSVGIVVIMVAADLLNIPTSIGIPIDRLNTRMWGLLVPILVFCMTYYFVSRWQTTKEINRKLSAKLILKEVYLDYAEGLKLLSDKQVIDNLVDQLDGSSVYLDESIYNGFMAVHAEYYEMLQQFISDGIIEQSHLSTYLEITSKYKSAVREVLARPYLRNSCDDKFVEVAELIASELKSLGASTRADINIESLCLQENGDTLLEREEKAIEIVRQFDNSDDSPLKK